MGYKRNIKDSVRKMLYANSGNVCAMYGCSNSLIHANTSNISEICHIEAVNEDGTRYNANLTDEYVNSYENLILLCPTCHSIVDNKLNEGFYTVSYLKTMKKYHEQQVQEVMMKKAAIEPPIYLEGYDISEIVTCYNYLYENEINEKYTYKVLKIFLSMNIAIRSIVYGIAILCSEEGTDCVDVHRLNEMVNLDIYKYAEILMLLEQQKLIEEVDYTDPLAGYETADGDWHLVQNDYLYKTVKGTWYLKKRGRLIVVVCDIFKNNKNFYDFIVNRNLEMLKTIKNN